MYIPLYTVCYLPVCKLVNYPKRLGEPYRTIKLIRQSKSKSFPVHTVKVYEGVVVKLHSFLSLAIDAGDWSVSRLGRYKFGGLFSGTIEQENGWAQGRSGRSGEGELEVESGVFESVGKTLYRLSYCSSSVDYC